MESKRRRACVAAGVFVVLSCSVAPGCSCKHAASVVGSDAAVTQVISCMELNFAMVVGVFHCDRSVSTPVQLSSRGMLTLSRLSRLSGTKWVPYSKEAQRTTEGQQKQGHGQEQSKSLPARVYFSCSSTADAASR